MANEVKVALVTGSSSGIGESTVKLFSKRGYKVVVVGSKDEKVQRVAKECLELSPNKLEVSTAPTDLTYLRQRC